ncbi:MAG: hypothetical protein RL148_1235 [Planctomycetota bacterium]
MAAACAVQPQAAMHGYDVYPLLAWFGTGSGHPQHPLYLPVGELLQAVLGTSPHESLLVLSALATGLASALVHATARVLGFDRVLAVAATILFALLPAVVHFGTVVEMHAPFVAAYGCCWLLAARWRNCIWVRPALLLGALSGAATLLHATGHLAVLVLGPSWCLLAASRPGRGACARALGALLVAHATVWGVGFLCLQHLRPPLHDDDPVRFLARHWEAAGLVGASGHALWAEWLLPFLPVSIVLPVVAAMPQWRRAGSWALLVVAGYVLLSGILLWSRNLEHGSYLLVLAAPLVLLCAAALPRAVTWLMVPLAAAATLHHLGSVDREPADPVFGSVLAAHLEKAPAMVVVAGFAERDGLVQQAPRARLVSVDELLATLDGIPAVDVATARLWLAQQAAGAPNRTVLITRRALGELAARHPALAQAVAAPSDGLDVVPVDLVKASLVEVRLR